jgi:hypothetical protein
MHYLQKLLPHKVCVTGSVIKPNPIGQIQLESTYSLLIFS